MNKEAGQKNIMETFKELVIEAAVRRKTLLVACLAGAMPPWMDGRKGQFNGEALLVIFVEYMNL